MWVCESKRNEAELNLMSLTVRKFKCSSWTRRLSWLTPSGPFGSNNLNSFIIIILNIFFILSQVVYWSCCWSVCSLVLAMTFSLPFIIVSRDLYFTKKRFQLFSCSLIIISSKFSFRHQMAAAHCILNLYKWPKLVFLYKCSAIIGHSPMFRWLTCNINHLDRSLSRIQSLFRCTTQQFNSVWKSKNYFRFEYDPIFNQTSDYFHKISQFQYRQTYRSTIVSTAVSVDTFFVMSGFLVSSKLLKLVSKWDDTKYLFN